MFRIFIYHGFGILHLRNKRIRMPLEFCYPRLYRSSWPTNSRTTLNRQLKIIKIAVNFKDRKYQVWQPPNSRKYAALPCVVACLCVILVSNPDFGCPWFYHRNQRRGEVYSSTLNTQRLYKDTSPVEGWSRGFTDTSHPAEDSREIEYYCWKYFHSIVAVPNFSIPSYFKIIFLTSATSLPEVHL